MSVRNGGRQIAWMVTVLALGFALATCSSNKSKPPPSAQPTKSQAAAQPESSTTAATQTKPPEGTTPGAESTSPAPAGTTSVGATEGMSAATAQPGSAAAGTSSEQAGSSNVTALGTTETSPASSTAPGTGTGMGSAGGTSERMGAAMTPLGDRVEVRQSWVQVRAKPSADSAAIALAFGNDTFPVLGHEGNWVHVQLPQHRDGWIPLAATQH